MDLTLNRFNRIINLYFYTTVDSVVPARVIRCPRHGRKPTIEINGTYTSRFYLPEFNITVKNLYLDYQTEQYAKVKVEAGYSEGKPCAFEGTILSMYQEAPGPEGRTVIQCQQGKMEAWLNATVQLEFQTNTALREVLESISSKLGTSAPKLGTKAQTLMLPEPGFLYDGTARGAMAKLEEIFEEDDLVVYMRENSLYAQCMGKDDNTGAKVLQYMSAPPQPNTGGKNGVYYTTVTAPWMPDLQLFDKLIIPSRIYIRNFGMVGTGKTQKIQVNALSFHFGTTGSVNSMTVQGSLAR